MRHLTILGKIGGGEVGGGKIGGGEIGGEESIWTQGRLSMYFLCGNANKIYLDALNDVIPLSNGRSRIWRRPELAVESGCPESFR